MTESILSTPYFLETDRITRKKILDSAISNSKLSPELELCQKLYNARYGISNNKREVDYFIRGLMTLKYIKNCQNTWYSRKRIDRERNSVLNDFQFNLINTSGQLGKNIIYHEYCNLIRVYLKLCEHDRTYSSFIFGLGKISRTTFEKKLSDDIYHIAYTALTVLNLEGELSLFSKAASDIFCSQYPRENESFHKRIKENIQNK